MMYGLIVEVHGFISQVAIRQAFLDLGMRTLEVGKIDSNGYATVRFETPFPPKQTWAKLEAWGMIDPEDTDEV